MRASSVLPCSTLASLAAALLLAGVSLNAAMVRRQAGPQSMVLGPCNDDSSCTIANSYCNKETAYYTTRVPYAPQMCSAPGCPPPPAQYYWCVCKPGYQAITHEVTPYCEPTPKTRLGGYCQSSEQCSSPMAVCLPSSRICDCREGYTPTKDLTGCLPLIMDLGETPCQENHQCTQGRPGPYSYCIPKREPNRGNDPTKFCQCTSQSVEGPEDHTCRVRAQAVGQHCKVNSQCMIGLGFSLCVNGRCSCNPGYRNMQQGKCTIEYTLHHT